jgi:hypothetical protein
VPSDQGKYEQAEEMHRQALGLSQDLATVLKGQGEWVGILRSSITALASEGSPVGRSNNKIRRQGNLILRQEPR